MKHLAWTFATCALLAGAGRVESAPVVYTFSGTGTGRLGNNSFTDAAFTISPARSLDAFEYTLAQSRCTNPVQGANTPDSRCSAA